MSCADGAGTELRLAHSGDIGDYRDVVLNGVEDLSEVASIEAHVTRGGTTATLAAQVQDVNTRTVRIFLGDAGEWLPSGPDIGRWLGQIEAVFNDGSELTWPSTSWGERYFAIEVVRELG